MKAVAVLPGQKNSVHEREVPEPRLTDQPHPHICKVPEGRAVRVRALQVGVDATDREINEALYGNAPPGGDFSDHRPRELRPGGRGRRQGPRPQAGRLRQLHRPAARRVDLRRDRPQRHHQRGNLLRAWDQPRSRLHDRVLRRRRRVHGQGAAELASSLGVLSEPASVCAKAIDQAYLAQQRLQVWEPKRAFVLGAGQIGLLATMMLKLRGLEVYTLATQPGPHLKSRSSRLTARPMSAPSRPRWPTWRSRWASPT